MRILLVEDDRPLAQAVLGLLPHAGELQVVGGHWHKPAIRNSAANLQLRRRIQVVFQDPFSSLSPRMTVEEIVGEGLQIHAPALGVEQRRERVIQIEYGGLRVLDLEALRHGEFCASRKALA